MAEVNRESVLILTGGEPLLRPDIYDLVGEASALGFWTVLGSHGGLLDERAAERLAAAGLKGVGVSLDSVDAARHDAFRGIPGAWRKTVAALDVMRRRGLSFLIEMTVTRDNRREIATMAECAMGWGAAALNVFFLVPTGRGATVNGLAALETEECLRQIALLQAKLAGGLMLNAKCAPQYRRVLWELDSASPFVRTFRGGGCPAGTYYCRLGPTGDVTPCPYMDLPVGNIRQSSFADIWRSSPVLRSLREEKRGGRCGACEFAEMCGGCRCRAYAVTGDILAEDPGCSYQPGSRGGQPIRLPAEGTYGAAVVGELEWTAGARERLSSVPFFARGMVEKAVEKAALKRGLSRVD